jgi:cation transport regulator
MKVINLYYSPLHAQEIYRAAFNNAWDEYADRIGGTRDEIAHRVAWAAVKKLYQKSPSGDWMRRVSFSRE